MNNFNISEKLKQLRKINKLKISDVVFKLSKYNLSISPKTIYKWEQGNVLININSLIALCNIYNTSIQNFFDDKSSKFISVNALEKNFLNMIRTNENYKKALLLIIKKDIGKEI